MVKVMRTLMIMMKMMRMMMTRRTLMIMMRRRTTRMMKVALQLTEDREAPGEGHGWRHQLLLAGAALL